MPKYANMPPGSTVLWDPTLPRQPREFADRGFTTPNLLPLETPNAGIPILRIRATCPRSDQRSRSIRGIALRDFKWAWDSHLANPDSPMCEGSRSFVRLRLKPLAAPPRSNDPQNLVSLLDDSKSPILFLWEEFSALPPFFGAASTESTSRGAQGYPFRASSSDSFREPSCTLLTPRFSTTPLVSKFFRALSTYACNTRLLRLATEARPRPAPTCAARINKSESGRSENKGSPT
jgi:hypothetical protein